MGNNKLKKPHHTESEITKYLKTASSKVENLAEDFFTISFRHLDKTQADNFYSWEKEGILAHAMDVLSDYCKAPLISQYSKKFKCYGAFPPKSIYKCPTYIPEDANWGRIHINGTQILAGHIVKNVFYVVFLDSQHGFWETDIQDK